MEMEVLNWAVGAVAETEDIVVAEDVTATPCVVVVVTVVTDTSETTTEDNLAESPPSTVGSNLPANPCPRPLRLLLLRRLSLRPRRLP
ncbi:unnamed protein product [Heligmosomoides polygyrus]|uniref:Uncharacterized protein n=1 Tax=Heligmosomoides polygyrus TaxID=6339 RepID=A0A183F9J7_HELPZ|nr:unnamed protein product [Heligmosomoides polygyrus]